MKGTKIMMMNTGRASLTLLQETFSAFSNNIIPIINSIGDVPLAGVAANNGLNIVLIMMIMIIIIITMMMTLSKIKCHK